jgi:exodeoxyribonuclease VII small subunit
MSEQQTFNIDDALNELEEINKKLSAKEISLDDSIRLYNEGTVLASKCQEHLAGVEKALQIVNAE